MFVVLLKFSDNKSQASDLMEGHKERIKRGFDDGVFLLAGSLQPQLGNDIRSTDIPKRQSVRAIAQCVYFTNRSTAVNQRKIEL